MGDLKIDFMLVQRLRKAFDLYEGYSAEQVLEITKGTTSRALIELGLAADRCGYEVRDFAKATVAGGHLNEVREGYLQHAAFALKGAGHCLLAAGALVIHAVAPRWFQRSASTRLNKLVRSMVERYK